MSWLFSKVGSLLRQALAPMMGLDDESRRDELDQVIREMDNDITTCRMELMRMQDGMRNATRMIANTPIHLINPLVKSQLAMAARSIHAKQENLNSLLSSLNTARRKERTVVAAIMAKRSAEMARRVSRIADPAINTYEIKRTELSIEDGHRRTAEQEEYVDALTSALAPSSDTDMLVNSMLPSDEDDRLVKSIVGAFHANKADASLATAAGVSDDETKQEETANLVLRELAPITDSSRKQRPGAPGVLVCDERMGLLHDTPEVLTF